MTLEPSSCTGSGYQPVWISLPHSLAAPGQAEVVGWFVVMSAASVSSSVSGGGRMPSGGREDVGI